MSAFVVWSLFAVICLAHIVRDNIHPPYAVDTLFLYNEHVVIIRHSSRNRFRRTAGDRGL